MFSIPVQGCDIVLGIAWLRTLGPILCDFATRRMAFTFRGRRVVWEGVGASRSLLAPEADGLLASTLFTNTGSEQDLLESYCTVFAAPIGLPPARACDHRIHLKPAAEPVAVRSYRYPQIQKDELEAQYEAMLQNGLIQPSTSPFAALGTSWCSGQVYLRQTRLGNRWTASVWLILRSSSRTSCFQREGVMLWSVRPIIVGRGVNQYAGGKPSNSMRSGHGWES